MSHRLWKRLPLTHLAGFIWGKEKQDVGTGPKFLMNYSTEAADIDYLTFWGVFF